MRIRLSFVKIRQPKKADRLSLTH